MRPTLPIIAPTADPDGPLGVQGGLGDLTVVDVFVHPMEELKTSVGAGYVAVLPTATHPQLGLGEWQVGPAACPIICALTLLAYLFAITVMLPRVSYATRMDRFILLSTFLVFVGLLQTVFNTAMLKHERKAQQLDVTFQEDQPSDSQRTRRRELQHPSTRSLEHAQRQ